MRCVIPLNRNWKYTPSFNESYITERDCSGWINIELPHTNHELPLTYFDEKSYQFISTYSRIIALNELDSNKLNIIHFEGVMTAAKVYVNGHFVSEHKGGYTGFDVALNSYMKFDGFDEITVVVDSTERPDIPPFGAQVDYLTYGGIYREVQLRQVDPVYIDNVFAKPTDCLKEKKQLNVDVYLKNTSRSTNVETVKVSLFSGVELVTEELWNGSLSGDTEQMISVAFMELEEIELWELHNPNLYTVLVEVNKDQDSRRIGFREAVFTTEGFFLNGQLLNIRGLNRHQSFPYVGYAMPERVQKQDADILKNELGLNLVRTSHYPQSRHFLDRCDEIGLLVFEEIPGWQHIGDKVWQNLAIEHVREMIKRDWNHPSIVVWGVRVNESADNHEFYKETNAVAKKLDPTRQTTGVRCIEGSELLEDVYGMNDFALDGVNQVKLGQRIALRGQQDVTKLEYKVPYLVTEYNGHMFPTKKTDCEEHQQEHALRHLLVIDAGCADKEVAGTIGWCAFDYNTHKDFGAGDRICHHGVMDMFRLPKFAASAYHSQKSVDDEPVLFPMTLWTRGERAEGMEISPMLVATNCDKVELFIDDQLYGSYLPSRSHFKGLEFPPVVIPHIRGEWGMSWKKGDFVGFSNGREVIRKSFTEAPQLTTFTAIADSETLLAEADSWDATRIVLSAQDQCGNPLVYHNTIVNIEIDGAIELIGPKQIVLPGGTGALWVRSAGKIGTGLVSFKTSEGHQQSIVLSVQ
ncbi:beta-galactosidase [Shewanella sp. OPT22]|nr:beta-galactosidase [Shewanella sp. OPT22]